MSFAKPEGRPAAQDAMQIEDVDPPVAAKASTATPKEADPEPGARALDGVLETMRSVGSMLGRLAPPSDPTAHPPLEETRAAIDALIAAINADVVASCELWTRKYGQTRWSGTEMPVRELQAKWTSFLELYQKHYAHFCQMPRAGGSTHWQLGAIKLDPVRTKRRIEQIRSLLSKLPGRDSRLDAEEISLGSSLARGAVQYGKDQFAGTKSKEAEIRRLADEMKDLHRDLMLELDAFEMNYERAVAKRRVEA